LGAVHAGIQAGAGAACPGKANDLSEQPKREATANFEHHEKFAEMELTSSSGRSSN